MYVFQEFPKWMYHRTQPAVMVDDPAELEALGDGWAESPAAFDVPEVPVVVEDIGGTEDVSAVETPAPKRRK